MKIKHKSQIMHLSLSNKILRFLWNIISLLLFKPSPIFMHQWRRILLIMFGAKLPKSVRVYPSARIWAPWNLEMGEYSTIANFVDCYCVDKVIIGSYTTISQYSFLCTASHDYESPKLLNKAHMPLLSAPINIGNYCWIAADVFVRPGILIGDGAVVFARSSVMNNLFKWKVYSGSPAKFIKNRVISKNRV
jgi:putative colanic acid biosynthesis acetyltransferase WcaF